MKFLTIILVLPALMLQSCGTAGTPGNPAAAPPPASASRDRVSIEPSSPQLSRIRADVVGTATVPEDEVVAPGKVDINPNRISRIVLPVPGRIVSVEVRIGDAVAQGQALLKIESPEAEEAMSNYLRAEAAQMQARANQSKAQADLDRLRDLFEHGATAQKEVLHADNDVTNAQAALKDAGAGREQAARRLTILGLKPGEFGQHVVVRSPIAGKVLDLKVVPGEYRTETSDALITIADLSNLWVTSDVPESSIRLIEQGERVHIELAAYPGEVFEGRVMRIGDTVDPQTRCVQVRTELGNSRGRFRPEMFARIRHSHGTRVVPVVPRAAVLESEGRAWVFVEEAPGRFRRVAVETGASVGQSVAITSGVEAGQRVVVDAAILLQGSMGGSL
jgi:membrane fusion protein, heavy metal efflux system